LASANELRRVVVQVDDGNAAFLLMAEGMVATATATVSLSTIMLGASLLLGAGTMTIIPELLPL
jgi:hypothetical protein